LDPVLHRLCKAGKKSIESARTVFAQLGLADALTARATLTGTRSASPTLRRPRLSIRVSRSRRLGAEGSAAPFRVCGSGLTSPRDEIFSTFGSANSNQTPDGIRCASGFRNPD
jgi:hypothetical protein